MAAAGDGWTDILLDIWREGQQRSMVGPGDLEVHLRLAERLAATLDAPERALDLGSGAGIPGLALAGLWPASSWVLVDAALRRVRLLEQAVAELGWTDRVQVRHGRAEDLGRDAALREAFPLVTARSFGHPAVTAECGGSFVALDGVLVVAEPPEATGERWPASGLAELGLAPEGVSGGAQRLRRTAPLPERFPRRAGVPVKRPLF
ncbi:MAG: RsmG family class I SAM-dependent methyltransferase [Acidimicrobiia bacterium]